METGGAVVTLDDGHRTAGLSSLVRIASAATGRDKCSGGKWQGEDVCLLELDVAEPCRLRLPLAAATDSAEISNEVNRAPGLR